MVRGVSIVIPTYNRARLLGYSLESMFRLDMPSTVDAEIVVISNNCTDSTELVVKQAMQRCPWPMRHVIETQQGLCHCRNRALAEARYEHVVYLDDDVHVAENWVHGYVEAVAHFNADCVVGPVSPIYEIPVPPFLNEKILTTVTSGYSRKGPEPFVIPQNLAHEIPGCNFAVSKAAGLEVNGFDPDLDRKGAGLVAGGDFDFGARLVRAGKRVVYQPLCAIGHVISAEKLSKRYLRRRSLGQGITMAAMEQHRSRSWQRNLRLSGRALKFAMSAGRYHTTGNAAEAFWYELECRRLIGYLFSRVRGATPVHMR
jgi:glucosyl-dolichyl phosphate glucuronosyltransferase